MDARFVQKIRRKRVFGVHIVLMFAVIAMLILVLPGRLWNGDDMNDLASLEKTSGIEFVLTRARNWEPRLVNDSLIALFHYNLTAWKIITPLIFGLLCWVFSHFDRSIKQETTFYQFVFGLCLFFLIEPREFSASVIWYTGSLNYLYSAPFMLLALQPAFLAVTREQKGFKSNPLLVLFSTLMAAYMLQMMAVMLGFILIAIIFLLLQKQKCPRLLVAQLLFLVLNIGIYISFGGTSIRSNLEIAWYPNYRMLSLADRVFQAVNYGNEHLIKGSALLFLFFTMLIYLLVYSKNQSKIVRVLSGIPACFTLLCILPFDSLQANTKISIIKSLTDCMANHPESLEYGFRSLLPCAVVMTIVLFTAIVLMAAFQEKRRACLYTLLYIAALMSSYSMAFSPTIFASGGRVFFVTDMLLILISVGLLKELMESYSSQIGKSVVYLCVPISAAMFLELLHASFRIIARF